jgi:hypothetical protein
MRRDAVEFQLRFGKRGFDFLGGLESAFLILLHEVRRLRPGRAGLFRVGEELNE